MTGMMVRMMRFQSVLMESGMTGWTLAVYFIALAGPMPKSQLFWIGTLMRLATGFWSFLAKSASCAAWSSAASETSLVVGAIESGWVLSLMLCAGTLMIIAHTNAPARMI